MIVADDLGYGETTVQGFTDQIPTPNIDSIAKNGVRFTSGYVSGPYCSPTRAGLMTGRYQERFGHEFNPGPNPPGSPASGLSLKERTFGDRMKSAGYATGWFGKSHLGFAPKFHPLRRGFDEFYGFLGASHSYVSPEEGKRSVFDGYNAVAHPGYLTTTFARKAADFIERKKDQPWFVYLPFNAVHAPLETLKRHEERFSHIHDRKRRKFAALLAALDGSVGTVLGKLRELNLEQDTLVFFISDNGGPTKTTTSRNGPLKGFKAQTSEGGIRVPFFVQWKGTIPPGQLDDRPVIQLDILPTSLAAAGVQADPSWKLDGVNLLPYLNGSKAGLPHEVLYWRFGTQMAIRKGPWKLVKSSAEGIRFGAGAATTRGARLYNLARDIGERNNLAGENPAKAKELDDLWTAWNGTLASAKWLPAPRGAGITHRHSALVRRSAAEEATADHPAPDGTDTQGTVAAWTEISEDSDEYTSTAPLLPAILAEIQVDENADGVIVSSGGSDQGLALHIKNGRPVFSVRRHDVVSSVESGEPLKPGKRRIEVFLSQANGAILRADGETLATGTLEIPPASVIDDEAVTIIGDGRPPAANHQAPIPFNGRIIDLFAPLLGYW